MNQQQDLPDITVKKSTLASIEDIGTKAFIALFFIYHVIYILGFLTTRYLYILPQSQQAISLGLIVILTFLLKRGFKGNRKTVPWYDWLLIIGGVVGCFYMAPTSRMHEVAFGSPVLGPLELSLGVITIVVLLEGTRRVSGIVLPLILVFFILYAMYCNYFPGFLLGEAHSFNRVMSEIYLSWNGIFGDVMSLWTTILVVFLLFGGLLEATGAGRFFIDLALAVAGHVRGGPAKVAIIGSALFGTLSGSAAANVATTGVITIPMMKGVGYKPTFAGAVESVASTGGIIMPPMMGMVAFLIAEFMGIPYVQVVLAAVIPAILYYFTLYWGIDFEALKTQLHGMPKADMPSLKQTLRGGWFYFIPLLALIYFLVVVRYPAGLAALYSLGVLILVTLFKKESRLTPKRLMAGFEASARSTLVVAIICGSVGILITSVNLTGAALRTSIMLTQVAGGSTILLLVIAGILSLILGTGIPAMASYIFLAVTIAPALTHFGIPLLAANFFIFYWGTSHVITPPVGGALYVASSLAGTDIWHQGYTNVRLGIAVYLVPFLFAFHPALLLIGTPSAIALATVCSLIAMFSIASGLSGYLVKPMNWMQRVILLCGATGFIVQSVPAVLIGTVLIVIVIIWQGVPQLMAKRLRRTTIKSD